MKREARDLSALKRLKNTAGRRASGENVVDLVFVLCKLWIFCLAKPGINNNNNYELVVRKFHTYMFKCALQ